MNSFLPTAALVTCLLFAPATYAQSSGEGSVSDAPPDDLTAPATPTPVNAIAYLRMADSMPFGDWEFQLNDTLRLYRMGTIPLSDAQERLRMMAAGARTTATILQGLTPPPQMAHVHALNISAANEYALGFDFGLAFLNGDVAARSTANAHLLHAEDFAEQAREELR